MNDQKSISAYLAVQIDVIVRLAPKVARLQNVELVHKLRVATRRAQSAVWMLRHDSVHFHFKKLRYDLVRLEQALGSVRELDVAILDANHYRIESRKIDAQRKDLRKVLQTQLSSGQIKNITQQVFSLQTAVRTARTSQLRKSLEKLRQKMKHQLKRPLKGKASFHQIRVTLKKARYVLEARGQTLGEMKRLQDILGEAHDIETLQKLVGKTRKTKVELKALNRKAARHIKPALRFAILQLGIK